MKYFLRWSEKKHCWEMCARPSYEGYEAQIVGHLSLEQMDKIIYNYISQVQDWKELAGGEYKGKTADYVKAREKQRQQEAQ